MKTATLLVAAVIIILMLPAAILAVDQFRLSDQTDPFVVPSGSSASEVTLSQDLYGDETRNAAVSSNVTTDAPIASTYTAATNVLAITGLDDEEEHYLTVTYKIDRLADYFGAGAGSKVLPVLLVLGVLCIVGGAGYHAFSHRE